MRQSDFAYVNDVRAAIELRTPKTARMLLFTICAMLVVGIIWAYFAVLDEVKRGDGRVIPSRQMQVVQTLEGGIVREILIEEGAIVKKDQPLMRIDDTNFAAQFGEIREKRAATAARVARLEAEAASRKPEFDKELRDAAPQVVATELSVYDARARKLAQDLEVLQQTQTRLNNSLQLLSRELELTRKLYAQKVVPEIEMIRIERQESETRGQLAETSARLNSVKTSFISLVEEDLAKSRSELAVLDESIKSASDRLRRTELRSPVYGVINKLYITTIGAVVQPANNVMDIVPLDDTLLVEGRIRPQDIAFIRPGQDAVVKITAYDPSVYGSLKGKVERISADTIVEKNAKGDGGETFYRVIVRTEKNALGTAEAPLPIIPGMVATVEVLTGAKSVLDYLMKPARLLRDEALRER